MILIGNGIDIVQKFTKWNKKRLKRKAIRGQYRVIKHKICEAIMSGSYHCYYDYFLYSKNRIKLEKKGFVLEPRMVDEDGVYDFWKISWEKKL